MTKLYSKYLGTADPLDIEPRHINDKYHLDYKGLDYIPAMGYMFILYASFKWHASCIFDI